MDEKFFEKKVDSHQEFNGIVLKVHRDEIELPSGHCALREYIRHPGTVVIARDVGGRDREGQRPYVCHLRRREVGYVHSTEEAAEQWETCGAGGGKERSQGEC